MHFFSYWHFHLPKIKCWIVSRSFYVWVFWTILPSNNAIYHRDLDHSVFVSLFGKLFLFCFCTVLSSRDLASQWPAVHNENKQRFLNETFKQRWCTGVIPDINTNQSVFILISFPCHCFPFIQDLFLRTSSMHHPMCMLYTWSKDPPWTFEDQYCPNIFLLITSFWQNSPNILLVFREKEDNFYYLTITL